MVFVLKSLISRSSRGVSRRSRITKGAEENKQIILKPPLLLMLITEAIKICLVKRLNIA